VRRVLQLRAFCREREEFKNADCSHDGSLISDWQKSFFPKFEFKSLSARAKKIAPDIFDGDRRFLKMIFYGSRI
jgi:hypothetical protein